MKGCLQWLNPRIADCFGLLLKVGQRQGQVRGAVFKGIFSVIQSEKWWEKITKNCFEQRRTYESEDLILLYRLRQRAYRSPAQHPVQLPHSGGEAQLVGGFYLLHGPWAVDGHPVKAYTYQLRRFCEQAISILHFPVDTIAVFEKGRRRWFLPPSWAVGG